MVVVRRRPLRIGVAAASAYLLLALVSFTVGSLPTIPLYDGASIGPYRFVDPPKPLAEFNRPPFSYRERLPLTTNGVPAHTAATVDNQATVTIPDNAVEGAAGEQEIELRIDPLDPDRVGSAPKGTGYDGNAYRFTARYVASGRPVTVRPGCPVGAAPGSSPQCLTVIIHYAFGPVLGRGDTTLYRRSGNGWVALPTKDVPSLLHVYGSSGSLGTFVAAGPNRPAETNPAAFPTRLAVLLSGSALLAGVALRFTAPLVKRRRAR